MSIEPITGIALVVIFGALIAVNIITTARQERRAQARHAELLAALRTK